MPTLLINRRRLNLLPLVLTLFLSQGAASDVIDAAINKVNAAYVKGERFPIITADIKDLTIEQAYQIQRGFIKKRQRKFEVVTGYKGGLTTFEAPKQFGLAEPVVGTLLSKGRLPSNKSIPTISMADYHQLMIETEIGFVFDKHINKPIKDVEELKTLIRGAAAVVEIPDLGFSGTEKPKGLDLIANNVATKKYIVGRYLKIGDANMNTINPTLSCADKTLSQGLATHAMGGQWDALLWIVNNIINRGIAIEPAQLIITGALGGMTKGKPCKYVADFGPMGQIQFNVTL